MADNEKTAVVLFNLGGPDSLKAVRPFLYNLFSDPAIIRLPPLVRHALAWFIAARRAKTAQAIYAQMGGQSPLVEQTWKQAAALEEVLNREGKHYKVFFCMRHWHPMSALVAEEVQRYDPDRIVLLPLYPQYSTTTTASSLADWRRAARRIGLKRRTRRICCYPAEGGFIAAHAELLAQAVWQASQSGEVRVLFSAHGLPEKIVAAGDPYPFQVEQTVQAIMQVMAMDDLDYSICYQSRVGRLKWIGPSTEEEIRRAGREGKAVVVVPVAFVSEHSETLVELDVEYAELAHRSGVASYVRVPALSTSPHFIESLAAMVRQAAVREEKRICSSHGGRACPKECAACPCRAPNVSV